MKKIRDNPYVSGKGDIIRAPKDPAKNSPKATVVKGNDLRVKNSK